MEKRGKKKREKQPPVVTGYDERCRQRARDGGSFGRKPEAPDGISGNWN